MAKKTTGICMGYKYRIYPNKEQQSFINQTIGCCRKVWNEMLAINLKLLAESREAGTKFKQDEKYNQLYERFPFLQAVESVPYSYVCHVDMGAAFKRMFTGVSGAPCFKKKMTAGAYSTDSKRTSLSEDGRWLKLPKIGKATGKAWMRIVMHRPLPAGSKLGRCTVSRTATGEYYVTFVAELPEGQRPEFIPVDTKETGIDLGLESFITLADGTKVDNPRFLQKSLAKLRREQRKLSRMGRIAKEDGRNLHEAKNYQKQRLLVAKLHQKVARQREYFLHTLSTKMVREHTFIAMETLDIKGMMQQRKLSRQIADVSWYEFGRQLMYKADWAGRTVVKINQWFPSTQKCHCCGHVMGPIPTVVRQWQCPECGEVHDRDVNAAINIYQEGKKLQELTV